MASLKYRLSRASRAEALHRARVRPHLWPPPPHQTAKACYAAPSPRLYSAANPSPARARARLSGPHLRGGFGESLFDGSRRAAARAGAAREYNRRPLMREPWWQNIRRIHRRCLLDDDRNGRCRRAEACCYSNARIAGRYRRRDARISGASATAAAVPKGKSPRRFVVGSASRGGQRISHPRLAAGLPPDDRLGTLVTRGRFRVVGSPGGSGGTSAASAPAWRRWWRRACNQAAPLHAPHPAAAAAAAAQAAQASAAGSSAAAQQGGRGGAQQQAAAKVIDRTWLDPSLLDGLCGAAQACTLALKKEAPSGGGSNSPRGVAGGGGSSSTSSSSSSLHILLNLLEARRERCETRMRRFSSTTASCGPN